MFLQRLNLPPSNQVPAGAPLQSAPVPFVRRRWRNTGYRVRRRIYTLRHFNGILKNRRSSEFDRLEKQLSRKVPQSVRIPPENSWEKPPPSFSCRVLFVVYKGTVRFPQCTAHGGLAGVRRFSCLLVEDGWRRWMDGVGWRRWMEELDGGVGWSRWMDGEKKAEARVSSVSQLGDRRP